MSLPSASRIFPPLPVLPASAPKSRLRVCLVSPEFVGPSNNGGIGTAYTALADALAEAGHEVTCLYTKGTECATKDMAHWVAQFRARRLTLVPLPGPKVPVDAIFYSARSFAVYEWLKQHDHFDFVHFPEWQALGYHSQVAKRQGLAFARTCFCVGLHSMTEWLKHGNREYLAEQAELQLEHMERETVARADVVVSPSCYLLEWIQARGWTLPAVCHVQQNIMPRSARRRDTSRPETGAVDEIVFFGRIETRKGVQLFCDALDRLAAAGNAGPARVTFLGKDAIVDGVPGETYVRQRAKLWSWPVQFLNDRSQPQAMEYLRGKGRLAVMPSLIENSPYTVLECLGAGIAFLAARVGGIPELIAPAAVDEVCFEPKPDLLAAKIGAALTQGFRPAEAAVGTEANERAWVAWHEQQVAAIRSTPLPAAPAVWPKVSLSLTTFNRPTLLRQALASVRAITYPNLEVILVDDGSTQPEALAYLEEIGPDFAARGWQVVRQSNRYLGAARNTGVRHATGDFLLFMDDDNCAEPHEVTVLVQAMLRSGADIICCGMNYFSGPDAPDRRVPPKGRWLPLGGAASAGALANVFGDANALVRRTCFEAVGGFTEDYGVTHEDWEFHAKAVLRGFKLEVAPEFLFWYRVNAGSMIRTLAPYPNYMRSIRPYVDAVPPALRHLVLYAQGLTIHQTTTGGGAGWAQYMQLTVQWRSKLEAGLALVALGQEPEAAKLMIAGVKAVEACKHPRVILEALLEICPHLGRLDAGRARFLLGLAINLADSFRRPEEKARAEALLAALAARPPAPADRMAVAV